MKNCSISLYRSFLFPLLFLGVYPLFANDCGSAITVDISPAASKYTCSSPASGTFSGGCDQLYTVPSAGCIDPSICGQDLWFQFNPLDGNFPTNQYNMIFELSFSGMSNPDQIRYYLLYAEATNSPNGDDCAWDFSNTFSQVFTQRASGCWNISAAAMDTSFIAHGLDGSGTFFLVLETAFGTGGSVDVCLKYDPDLPLSDTTCAPPSNDRASNATTMVVGSGIDSQAGVGGANSWAESITGTNQCATKQRMQNECIGGSAGNTEDHFYTSLFSCITDNCIGDQFFFGVRSGRCVGTNELLDNTVFFTFQRPPADPAGGWYLNIGNISCPTQGPDSITVIIADTFNIADAQSTTLLTCGNFGATGLFPTPDGYLGPMTLNAGQTYAVIVDGIHGAGCDFTMILTRDTLNPVLSARFTYFEGEDNGEYHQLKWAIEQIDQPLSFQVERSQNGWDFQAIAQIESSSQNDFQFTDPTPPFGKSYYRIKATGPNGSQILSEVVELTRHESSLNIHSLFPVPANDHIWIDFSTAYDQSLKLTVFDLAGKKIRENSYNPTPGSNSWRYSIADLAKGVYFFQFNQGKKTLIEKIIKQ